MNKANQLVKHDLFKKYNEQEIIKQQQGLDTKKNSLYIMPLSSLFGFFEATYYTKVTEQDNQKTLSLYLISDKPFSKDEIKVLKARLLVVYNQDFTNFKIYQAPEKNLDADKWIHKRHLFKTAVNGDVKQDPIYRIIGKIAEFPSDIKLHHYDLKESGNKAKKQLSLKEQFKLRIYKMLKQAIQSKNYADFIIQNIEAQTDGDENSFTVYIISKDARVSQFFANIEMTTKLAQQHFKKVRSFEVINLNELE